MDLLSPRARTLDLRSALASDVSSSWPSTSSEIPLTDDVTVLLLDDNGLEHLEGGGACPLGAGPAFSLTPSPAKRRMRPLWVDQATGQPRPTSHNHSASPAGSRCLP